MKKKRPITLLEVMIVIFLIALIGSVVGYNMKGSMDKGRTFKTKQAAEKLKQIVLLEIDNADFPIDEIDATNARILVKNSGLVSNADDVMRDGWKEEFKIHYVKKGQELIITSDHYPPKE